MSYDSNSNQIWVRWAALAHEMLALFLFYLKIFFIASTASAALFFFYAGVRNGSVVTATALILAVAIALLALLVLRIRSMKAPKLTDSEAHDRPGYAVLDDSDLLRIADGDKEAFWSLWLRHRKYLFSSCLIRFPESPEDAEDVVSRAMLKAWEILPSQALRVKNARAWLAELTINVCLDFQRERGRHPRNVSTRSEPEGGSMPSTKEVLPGNEMKLIGELVKSLPPT